MDKQYTAQNLELREAKIMKWGTREDGMAGVIVFKGVEILKE